MTTAFLELFVSLSVQVTIVIGAAAWIAQRRQSEGEAYRVWAAFHFLVLVLVLLAVLVPHLRLLPAHPMAAYTEPANAASLGNTLGAILFFLWSAGAAVGFFALILGTLHAVRILRSCDPFMADDHAFSQSEFATASKVQPQAGNAVQLLRSPTSAKAFCWQFHRPYIVLPDAMWTFPADELQGVVRHEIAHLEAGHPLHLFMQRIVEILFWFHPLVWWASRQAAWSREFHCDASAVVTAQEASSYLRGLLRMTDQRLGGGLGLPAGLAFASGASLIQRRAKRIAARDWDVSLARSSFAVLVAPLVVCSLVACAVWLPVNAGASSRSVWSPWPKWSATALHELGIAARDYELDGHRVRPHEHLARGSALHRKVTPE